MELKNLVAFTFLLPCFLANIVDQKQSDALSLRKLLASSLGCLGGDLETRHDGLYCCYEQRLTHCYKLSSPTMTGRLFLDNTQQQQAGGDKKQELLDAVYDVHNDDDGPSYCLKSRMIEQHGELYQCKPHETLRNWRCKHLRKATPEETKTFKIYHTGLGKKGPIYDATETGIVPPPPRCEWITFRSGHRPTFCCFKRNCCKNVMFV